MIYRSSKHSENNLPNIKKHLDNYKIILINRNVRAGEVSISEYDDFVKGKCHIDYVMIASSMRAGNFYALSYARDEEEFNGPKLVSPQRSYQNTFCYNELPWYASADVYFITQKNLTISLKYILALLNSKLYFFWLYHRGKRKGEMLELYQKPLSEIPIKVISPEEQLRFTDIVDQILSIKQKDQTFNTNELETKIDKLVYEMYGLTNEEIAIVEGKTNNSKSELSPEVVTSEIVDEISESGIVDRPFQSDYDLYKCDLCGKMVLGHDRENHSKEYHHGQAEWDKLKK